MDIRVVPFEEKHLADFKNRDGQAHGWWPSSDGDFEIGYSLLVDGLAVGCAGIIINRNTRSAWAWASFGDDIPRHAIMVTRIIRRFLKDATRAYGLERIETMVLANSEVNKDWIRSLGFRDAETVTRFVRE